MPITLEEAKNLKYGDTLQHDTLKNADGKTPMVFKVTGQVKTWKRDPERIKVPLKRGLYEYAELTNGTWEGNRITLDLSEVSLNT